MKKQLLFILMFFSALALANTANLLSKDEFQIMSEFKHIVIDKVYRVFVDDIQQEDLYEVAYSVEGKCASFGETDACEMISFCEYIWIDVAFKSKKYFFPRETGISCDQDIDIILKPVIIDEY